MRDVVARAGLVQAGFTPSQVRAQLAAGRWRMTGTAVVRHNGPLTRRQRWDAALVNTGPRAALTGFTAAEAHGLAGWQRDWIDVLVPVGVARPHLDGIEVRIHRTRNWTGRSNPLVYRLDTLAHSLVVAARSFPDSRSACGLFAAAVQQRLTTTGQLLAAVDRPSCTRHARALRAALLDIAGGAQAMSEIDLVRLCRRYRLPEPCRQAARRDANGRTRYLDAYWEMADGRTVIAEVDGGLHLDPMNWWRDQQRQNALSVDGAVFLRFPSWAIRSNPASVARQLRTVLRS
jgi:hypothetical protein